MRQQGSDAFELATHARASQLRMARAWESQGSYNLATDLYLRLVKRYRGSEEAHEAFESLLALASMYEQQGQFHLARALYDEVEGLM